MPEPLTWIPLKVSGTKPTPRSGHSLCPVGKMYILFGGLDNEKKDGKVGPNNQVYALRLLSNNNCEWRLQKCEGSIPLARTNHAACAISNDEMMVFGGYFSTHQRFNDTYILKTSNWEWSQPPNQKSGTEPKKY